MEAIASHIIELTPQGCTNREACFQLDTKLLQEYSEADPEKYENRSGEVFSTEHGFDFTPPLNEAPNTGIQKSILLSRHVNLMQE